jgi:hypothetical protein
LIPLKPWINYLLQEELQFEVVNGTDSTQRLLKLDSSNTSWSFMSTILCLVFIIIKLYHAYIVFKDISNRYQHILLKYNYSYVNKSEIALDMCPICHGNYKTPVSLECRVSSSILFLYLIQIK